MEWFVERQVKRDTPFYPTVTASQWFECSGGTGSSFNDKLRGIGPFIILRKHLLDRPLSRRRIRVHTIDMSFHTASLLRLVPASLFRARKPPRPNTVDGSNVPGHIAF